MRYRSWGRARASEVFAFQEQDGEPLPTWYRRWHHFSVQARYFFLHVVKGPIQNQAFHPDPPGVSPDEFPPDVLQELVAAGFVAVQPTESRPHVDKVIACDGVYAFATRVRSMRRLHLLAADQPAGFAKHVHHATSDRDLREDLIGVLRNAGIDHFYGFENTLQRYVTGHRWPGWVAGTLKDPLAERILDVVRQAGDPLPWAELPGRLAGSNPGKVLSVVEKLVARLALVEDLKPETWEILVGFLPAVREEQIRASQPRVRPPLVVCERPKDVGPDGSVVVNDLRAVLLEVVSEPPRIRQDRTLFHKEVERFCATLEPLPPWLVEALKWSAEVRLKQALDWANALELVKVVSESKQARLHLNSKGQQWLSSGLDRQYTAIYEVLSALTGRREGFSPFGDFYIPGSDWFGNPGPGDACFLGARVAALKVEKGKRPQFGWTVRPDDQLALRTSVDRTLTVLQPGVFYREDNVEMHLVFREHNPVNRGLAPDEVMVFWDAEPIVPWEDQRERVGRVLLNAFVLRRLIPLGCVRVAIDDEGRICIARQPRYDAYFGREVAPANLAPALDVAARVVVQPDFSVIVIGQNPAAAAELAPFCERTARGGGQGAITFKITRDSIVKAVSHGLAPAEIVARLQRHATNEAPANVLRQVQDWSNWVRHVTSATLTVLRCGDRDTADRVMAALKRHAERINDTLVAIDLKKLTPTEHNKLQSHGIIVQRNSEAQEGKPKPGRNR
jgi:hypothetical protein